LNGQAVSDMISLTILSVFAYVGIAHSKDH
jgi:hypothetical protein